MNNSHKSIWNSCLDVIKDNITPVNFRTWFEPIVPLKVENNVLTIQVPSQFFYELIEEQYINILSKTLRKEMGPEAKLEYNIIMENNIFSNSKPYIVRIPAKQDTKLKNIPVSVPLDTEENQIKNPFIIPGIKKFFVDPQLNPDKTFNNFIEGDCNKLARSAGYAVSKNAGGTAFNPLLIYGGSGLGKTHLAQAIGIEIKEKFPEKIVLYLFASKFQTQFTEATRKNTINDFIHFYQKIDVLIIDDIHEFAGKEKTQDIFFNIFNHLHQSGKQLIFTCDKPPIELQGLKPRLLSRFKWGLSADLQAPDFETRIAILKQKIYNDGIEMPDEVLEYIASQITNNIRELESALISLLAQSTLIKKEITLNLTRQIIGKLITISSQDISIDYIQKIVCDYFNMHIEQLKSKTRKREIVQARQIAMFLSKNYTKLSLASIGLQIGGKDHATVLHACKTVNNLIDTDKKFRRYVDEIDKKLKI